MSSPAATPPARMRGSERRELVLSAAAEVFGERGYVGATTDAVARAAGVSQPYVVRMFGSKAALFEAVLERSLDRLLETFRSAAAEVGRSSPGQQELAACVGRNYVDLLRDRGILLSLMQAFMLGADPEIGPIARAGWIRVYRTLRDEIGLTPEAVVDVLSGGMLINTLVGVRLAADWEEPDVRELLETALPTKVGILRELADPDASGT
ncbi:TetR/AcrR family transcriptional regulator [Salana multivorans]|uniref:TetR/AcrR family transcriptional regulator n=1 Tax=Salana multivorans TaxID=120377 RepID=UPI0024928611|nr:TetR/AcrR family transcriptional regulator [Salana multivorans]